MNVIIGKLEFITVVVEVRKQECYAQVSSLGLDNVYEEKTFPFMCLM